MENVHLFMNVIPDGINVGIRSIPSVASCDLRQIIIFDFVGLMQTHRK